MSLYYLSAEVMTSREEAILDLTLTLTLHNIKICLVERFNRIHVSKGVQ